MADYRFISRTDLIPSGYSQCLLILSMLLKKIDKDEMRARLNKVSSAVLEKYQTMIDTSKAGKIKNLQAYHKKSHTRLRWDDFVKICVFYDENFN
jgi:hypothetical protein